jgi:hypothetical protein
MTSLAADAEARRAAPGTGFVLSVLASGQFLMTLVGQAASSAG